MSRIARLASEVFGYMKERVIPEISAEVGHSTSRGASELAAALFTGQGFVMYGPHRGPATELDQPGHQQPEQKHELKQEIEHEL